MDEVDVFYNRYNGQRVDDDGFPAANKYQCWDLANRFTREIVGAPRLYTRPGGNGGAIDCFNVFMSPLPDYFERIANNTKDANQMPNKGDLIVWGKAIGNYGHIGIVLSADKFGFKSFDQNWPVGSASKAVDHTYSGVIGWLRPKKFIINKAETGVDIMNTPTGAELYRTGLFREPESDSAAAQWNGKPAQQALGLVREQQEWKDLEHKLKVTIPAMESQIGELLKQKEVDQSVITSLKAELDTLRAEVAAVPAVDTVAKPILDTPDTLPATETSPTSADWRDTYKPYLSTINYQSTSDVTVLDYSNQQNPKELKVNMEVEGAGEFTRNKVLYVRTRQSAAAGFWYGIPRSSLIDAAPSSWLGDLPEDDSLFDLGITPDDPTLTGRERFVAFLAKVGVTFNNLRSVLTPWKKNNK